MTFETLQIERDAAVQVITLNRPRALNALNRQLLEELSLAIAAAATDDEVRALVLIGAGDRAFVAGADISELAALDAAQARAFAVGGQQVFTALETMGKPSIAAIHGFALGGGCELAMACTLRLAAEHARFGQPEVNLGIMPGYAGSQRLPRLVGKGRALEILLTGEMVPAARAYEIGLVNRVVPGADLMAEARKVASLLASKAPVATRYILEAVNHGLTLPLADAQFLEASLFGLAASTEDMKEGTKAFLEKRQPAWRGC
jgi:enoyl-CoA hydratase